MNFRKTPVIPIEEHPAVIKGIMKRVKRNWSLHIDEINWATANIPEIFIPAFTNFIMYRINNGGELKDTYIRWAIRHISSSILKTPFRNRIIKRNNARFKESPLVAKWFNENK